MHSLRSAGSLALLLGLGCARQIADPTVPFFEAAVPDEAAPEVSELDSGAPSEDTDPPAKDLPAPPEVAPPPEDLGLPMDDALSPPADTVTPPSDTLAPPSDTLTPPSDTVRPMIDRPSPDVPSPTELGCPSGQSLCAGQCRALSTDALHCGACGTICRGGIRAAPSCVMSRCELSCDVGNADCDRSAATGCEVNLSASSAHCGACNSPCTSGQGCVMGVCRAMCGAGLTLCGMNCVNPASDSGHCGMCGRACASGRACVGGACVSPPSRSAFQVVSLGSTGCATVDHEPSTGDDRGGIAVSNERLFYTGDTSTARFSLPDLSGGASLMRTVDGLLSNLRTGEVFTLAVGGVGLTREGGAQRVDTLLEIDGATGSLTGRRVNLSTPIELNVVSFGSQTGVFSGYDRAVILSGGRAYDIDLPTGAVSDRGAMAVPTPRVQCENWAFWGVAEFFGGNIYLDYVQSATTVVRTRVPDGVTSTLGTFSNLSDMCSFTVSPVFNRWYFHHEYSSQFGGTAITGEAVGYCSAAFSTTGLMCTSVQTPCGGACVDIQSNTNNCGSCGVACLSGQVCTSGVCGAPPLLRYSQGTSPAGVSFVDACGAAGRTVVLTSVDDSNSAFSLPFNFRFWGALIPSGTSVNIASNGMLNLDGTVTSGYPPASVMPNGATPNGVIAPHWIDLRTSASGVCIATLGVAPNRRFVVEWSAASYFAGGGPLTFEVVLNESDSTLDFLYQTMTGARTGVLVGLENPSGTQATGGCGSTACSVTTGTRIRFTPSP